MCWKGGQPAALPCGTDAPPALPCWPGGGGRLPPTQNRGQQLLCLHLRDLPDVHNRPPTAGTSYTHTRFYVTCGAKFGADFLAYPGDPLTHHSQFAVRVVAPGAPPDAGLLKAAVRSLHAARKQLVLASTPDEQPSARPLYTLLESGHQGRAAAAAHGS